MTDIRRLLLVLILDQVACSWSVNLLRAPQDLDVVKDNSSVIVAGSVIQLFCSASGQFTAPHIQWTRNNITIPETAQLPHLMVKSRTENNTITSSLLTIYDFSSSDNGSYQCVASDSDNSTISQPLLLSAINVPNMLKITRELNNNTLPDRTRVQLGSSNISISGAFLRCSAEQPASSSFTAPSMIWLKDGTQLFGDGVRVVINTNSTIGTSNRTLSFVRIFNFSQSDAGVYQCVFYDTPSQGGEVITTRPYKVDTGPVNLKALSPLIVTLSPPDPLVIQVETSGEYAGTQWTRMPIALNDTNGELVDFQQTFVRTLTSEQDWGLYQVTLCTLNCTQSLPLTFCVSAGANTSYVPPGLQSSFAPLPSVIPTSNTSIVASINAIIIIAVPICGGVALLLVLFLLVMGVGVAKCRWKEKDTLNVINSVFDKQSSTLECKDTIKCRSSLAGQHPVEDNSQPAVAPVCPIQDPHPPLPFGSYSQHIYDLMPSLSNPATIFENLDGVLEPNGVPLHSLATKDSAIYSSPILPKVPIPGYAVLDESIISSRSPSPEKNELEYSYVAVRRTLTRSLEDTGLDKRGTQTLSNPLADRST